MNPHSSIERLDSRELRLLPEAYLFGFAHVMHSAQGWNSFFNGEVRRFGWLGFFPYCLAAKTPLELFVLLAAGAGAVVVRTPRRF